VPACTAKWSLQPGRLALVDPSAASLGLASHIVDRRTDGTLPRTRHTLSPPHAERPEVSPEFRHVRECAGTTLERVRLSRLAEDDRLLGLENLPSCRAIALAVDDALEEAGPKPRLWREME
jgi:hypothetical protein